MPESMAAPEEWEQTRERSTFDSFMNREYTTVRYRHDPTGEEVIINEVQEPNNFEGWGYLVHATDPEHGNLNLVEDLDVAKKVAIEFMESYPN